MKEDRTCQLKKVFVVESIEVELEVEVLRNYCQLSLEVFEFLQKFCFS